MKGPHSEGPRDMHPVLGFVLTSLLVFFLMLVCAGALGLFR